MSPFDPAPETAAEAPAPSLRERAATALAELGLSQAKAAAEIGMPKASFNLWLNGRQEATSEANDRKVQNWLGSLDERAKVRRRMVSRPAFQTTPTAERIWAMLSQAQHGPDIVVIAGVPGIGKTQTAREYQRTQPNVWIATMDPSVRSPNVLMGELARSLGVTEPNSTRLKYAIGDRMAGTGGLLIIDETQHLKNRATLDMVRALHDQHEIGIAMLGNAGFFAGTGCGSSEDGFAQFFSRIGSRRMFRGPQAGDIEMMLDAYGIEGADERGFLGKVGRKLGALRALEKCIRMGAVLAAGSGEPPAVAHFKGAYADLAQAGEG